MTKTVEEAIYNGRLPIFSKEIGKQCYVFFPGLPKENVRQDNDQFMVPYFRVKREEVENWLAKNLANPPNPLSQYDAIILSYFDQDGGEPRYGAAFYVK